ncbi:MAG: class I SAM-dependent methyltransferase [Sideroxyarcus sp.]
MAKNQSVINSDQDFYDREEAGSLEDHAIWMREIESYFLSYADRLNDALGATNGNIAELGAGSCGLSVCLSRLPNVKKIASLDISHKRMEKMIELSTAVLGGEKQKITPVVSDFNESLPFKDEELDAILFDAALHHSRSIWHTLAECNRVLKPGGILIAQRESYLSAVRARSQIAKLLSTPEVLAKVSENIYHLEQYKYYLVANGFDVSFIPCSPGPVKRALKALNGLLFSDGVLFAKVNRN